LFPRWPRLSRFLPAYVLLLTLAATMTIVVVVGIYPGS